MYKSVSKCFVATLVFVVTASKIPCFWPVRVSTSCRESGEIALSCTRCGAQPSFLMNMQITCVSSFLLDVVFLHELGAGAF